MYQVLARKWRPQNFDEVVGQTQVTRTLGNAIRADRLAHAYIFAGIRGTGKTTVARILAKCLDCEKGPTQTPCGECTACREITESRSMDVLELDAASRTGVDNIRELQEVISYAPVRDRYKILIIDEAHMLSKQAFNALLKTLEEPPPNVIFILATTEIQKVLPTILSRCQVFEFRRVGIRELAEHLERICAAEEIRVSSNALERIARAGEGSVRDSLSVLERVLAFCGNEIEDEDVLRMLGGVRLEVLTGMLGGLAARDAGAMLGVLDGLLDEGHDLLHFWAEMISALRDLMLLRAVPERTEILARSAEEARALDQAATGLSDDDLGRAFRVLADLEAGLKASAQPRFLFEAALLRLASLGAVRPIEDVLRSLGSGGAAQKKSLADAPAPRRPERESRRQPKGGRARDLIDSVSRSNPMVAAVLEAADSLRLTDEGLELTYRPEDQAMARQMRRKENLEVVRREANGLLGHPVKIEVLGGTAGSAPPQAPPRETPSQPAASARPRGGAADATARRSGRDGRGSLLERAKRDPGVKKLLREFGAQVVDIRPLSAAQDPPLGNDETGTVEETS